MANISSNSKVAYMYDSASDMWYAIAGVANTNVPYTWTQAHIFGDKVTVNDVIKAKGGVNIFQNPSARDAAITTPIHGTMCFLKQNAGGNAINDLQIYDGANWLSVVDPLYDFNAQSSSYTLVIADSFKMIEMSSGGTLTIPLEASVNFPIGTAIDILQTGSSQVTIAGASGVTVNATPGLKLRAQWSSATIVKRSSDTWVAMGDLVA